MREIKFNIYDNFTKKYIRWGDVHCMLSIGAFITHDHLKFLQYTGLKDKNGVEIYEGDITEIEVDGKVRRFVVNIKTVIREVVSHPSFIEEVASVAITGVVFEWNGFELFPCVDRNGEFDNAKMVVVGTVYENPELLNGGA